MSYFKIGKLYKFTNFKTYLSISYKNFLIIYKKKHNKHKLNQNEITMVFT